MSTIRRAAIEDADLLARIIRESFAGPAKEFGLTPANAPTHPSNCTPEWIERDFGKGVRYFILEDDRLPCGCVAMEIPDPEFCYLERLAVLTGHRRKGFGRLLVQHVLDRAWAHGLRRVEIAIIAVNTDLQLWYEQQGFAVTSTKSLPSLPFDVTSMSVEQ